MKYRTEKTLTVHFTLDDSEAIMFEKGGYHKIEMSRNEVYFENWLDDINMYDKVIFTFQKDKGYKISVKNLMDVDSIDKTDLHSAKERMLNLAREAEIIKLKNSVSPEIFEKPMA